MSFIVLYFYCLLNDMWLLGSVFLPNNAGVGLQCVILHFLVKLFYFFYLDLHCYQKIGEEMYKVIHIICF